MLGDEPLWPASDFRSSATTTSPTRSPRLSSRAGRDAPSIRSRPGSRTFRAIPHRVEPVREVDGVLWINDSKSTNITSTEVAVASLDRPFVLLLGRAAQGRALRAARRATQGPLPECGGLRRGGSTRDA